MDRRELLTLLCGAVATTAGCGSAADQPRAFRVTSPSLADGGTLPERHTCAGAGASPGFTVERAPSPTTAFAVTVASDRGAITEPVLWSLWNVPAERTVIPSGLPRTATLPELDGARQGRPRGGEVGYEPPCPPAGEPTSYEFQVYALESALSVPGGTLHDDAVEAIGDATLASQRFTLSYTATDGDGG